MQHFSLHNLIKWILIILYRIVKKHPKRVINRMTKVKVQKKKRLKMIRVKRVRRMLRARRALRVSLT